MTDTTPAPGTPLRILLVDDDPFMDAGIRKAADTLARAHGLTLLGTIAKPATPAALAELLAQAAARRAG